MLVVDDSVPDLGYGDADGMTGTARKASTARASSGDGTTIFEARSLAVSIAGRPLLEGVDFELRSGEAVAVTGPSGCGKSTLLRTLAGLIDPGAGSLRLGRQAPDDLGFPEWRRRVTYVAQRPVFSDRSVRDNLREPFAFRVFRGRSFPEQRARDGLVELGLPDDCLTRDPRKLSEGQQQRVGLLRALLVEPEVLLLDEPTSALDPATLEQTERFLLAALSRRGGAAVVVTHDPAQVDRLCRRALALDDHVVAPSGQVATAVSSGGRGA